LLGEQAAAKSHAIHGIARAASRQRAGGMAGLHEDAVLDSGGTLAHCRNAIRAF
jgi:hypothetical protein